MTSLNSKSVGVMFRVLPLWVCIRVFCEKGKVCGYKMVFFLGFLRFLVYISAVNNSG